MLVGVSWVAAQREGHETGEDRSEADRHPVDSLGGRDERSDVKLDIGQHVWRCVVEAGCGSGEHLEDSWCGQCESGSCRRFEHGATANSVVERVIQTHGDLPPVRFGDAYRVNLSLRASDFGTDRSIATSRARDNETTDTLCARMFQRYAARVLDSGDALWLSMSASCSWPTAARIAPMRSRRISRISVA